MRHLFFSVLTSKYLFISRSVISMKGSRGTSIKATPTRNWSVMTLHTIITFALMLTIGFVVFFLTEYLDVLNGMFPTAPWGTAPPQAVPKTTSDESGAGSISTGGTNSTSTTPGTIIARAIGISMVVIIVLIGIEKFIATRFASYPRIATLLNYYGPFYTAAFVMTLTLFSLSFRLYSLSHVFSGHVMLGFAFGATFGAAAMIYIDHTSLFFVNTVEGLAKNLLEEGGAGERIADRLISTHLGTIIEAVTKERTQTMGEVDRQREATLTSLQQILSGSIDQAAQRGEQLSDRTLTLVESLLGRIRVPGVVRGGNVRVSPDRAGKPKDKTQ